MKTSSVFLVVLIFCHLCRAQTQSSDDDTAQTQGAGTEVDEGEQELVTQTDVWVELRNLRDMVVEQKVELRYLTARMRAAESIVEALEIKNTAMEARMTAAESLVEELQMENDVQAAELADAQQKLNTLQQRLTIGEHQVEELEKQQKVGKVAFSASLRTSGEGNTESTAFVPLIFKKVFTNVGNHYNLNTGAFTAPVRGAYYFRFTGHVAITNRFMVMRLVKNKHSTFSAGDRGATSTDREDNASNGMVLHLEVGDVVSVEFHGRVWDDQFHRTTFSGFLLFLF